MLGMYGDVCLMLAVDLIACVPKHTSPSAIGSTSPERVGASTCVLDDEEAVDRRILPRHEADTLKFCLTTYQIVRVSSSDILR